MTGYSAQGIVLVKRKPDTANEEVLKQQITLVAKDGAKAYTTSDLPGLVSSLNEAGIIVAKDSIYLKAKQTHVRNSNNDDIAVFNDDGSLNANLINADTITVNHLYAKSAQNGSVVGHFGNYDKSDATAGDTKCPLWLGSTTAANAPFRVTKEGKLYSVAGTIGGFDIGNNYIGSTDMTPASLQINSVNKLYLTDKDVIFNDNEGYWSSGKYIVKKRKSAAIGTEVSSTSQNWLLSLDVAAESADSFPCIARIFVENYNGAAVNSLTSRTGLAISVKDAGYNYAMYVSAGNVLVNGMNANIKYSRAILETSNINNLKINLKENNVWFVYCTNSSAVLVLPMLKDVEVALGYSAKDYKPFCIRLTIVGYRANTANFTLSGRSTSDKVVYNTQEYPWLYNYDASNTSFSMGAGDVCELLLTYDGSVYFAQVLSLNR